MENFEQDNEIEIPASLKKDISQKDLSMARKGAKPAKYDGLYDLLKLLDYAIEDSFTIIPGKLVVVKGNEILILVDEIEKALPEEIQQAQISGWRGENGDEVFSLLNGIRELIYQSKFLGKFVLINSKEFTTLLDRIYTTLPVQIIEARKYLNDKTA